MEKKGTSEPDFDKEKPMIQQLFETEISVDVEIYIDSSSEIYDDQAKLNYCRIFLGLIKSQALTKEKYKDILRIVSKKLGILNIMPESVYIHTKYQAFYLNENQEVELLTHKAFLYDGINQSQATEKVISSINDVEENYYGSGTYELTGYENFFLETDESDYL